MLHNFTVLNKYKPGLLLSLIVLGLVIAGFILAEESREQRTETATGTQTATETERGEKTALILKLAATSVLGFSLLYISISYKKLLFREKVGLISIPLSLISIPLIILVGIACVIYYFSVELHNLDHNKKSEASKNSENCMYAGLGIMSCALIAAFIRMGTKKK